MLARIPMRPLILWSVLWAGSLGGCDDQPSLVGPLPRATTAMGSITMRPTAPVVIESSGGEHKVTVPVESADVLLSVFRGPVDIVSRANDRATLTPAQASVVSARESGGILTAGLFVLTVSRATSARMQGGLLSEGSAPLRVEQRSQASCGECSVPDGTGGCIDVDSLCPDEACVRDRRCASGMCIGGRQILGDEDPNCGDAAGGNPDFECDVELDIAECDGDLDVVNIGSSIAIQFSGLTVLRPGKVRFHAKVTLPATTISMTDVIEASEVTCSTGFATGSPGGT